MKKALVAVSLIAASSTASAAWKVEKGQKAFSTFPPVVSTIATVPAKAPFQGVTARLQVECFTHPQLSGLSFGVVLSKGTVPGALGWRYQYDDSPPVQRGPFSRTSLTSISLGDAASAELKGLPAARRLRLTLLPAGGGELPYDFDVTGAAQAIKSVPCKEYKAP
jgi:hypothetical protein